MPSMPYSRKAGDGGACAVLIGAGDGMLCRECAAVYDRVIVIVLPGERPLSVLNNVNQFVVRGNIDIPEVLSTAFGNQLHITALEATDFYTGHECPGVDPLVRETFAAEFFHRLADRPFSLGDDVIDGLQGAFHIAMSAHRLIGSPTPDEIPRLSCPAIAVAPGPSLSKHLDAIKALQGKCIILCADTALEGLLRAGITPHYVTPLERVAAVVDESFPAKHYPGVIFAGTPAVHHAIAEKFDRHLLIPGSDLLFTWAGCRADQLFFYGQSTGVMAATLGTRLTTGPVHLVGHDLAFNDGVSHWGEVNHAVQLGAVQRIPVSGNNGKMVDSQMWWNTFRTELSELARTTGRIHNINAVTGDGAVINYAHASLLPDPESLPDADAVPEWPAQNDARKERFVKLLERLPKDVKGCLLGLSSINVQMRDIQFSRLCPSDNKQMLAYICRSILGQFSMQHLSHQDGGEAAEDCADALRNALRSCLPMFKQMAEAPICSEVLCTTSP